MGKKKKCLLCTYGGLAVAVLVLACGAALKYEPHFYRSGDLEPSAERKRLSMKFFADFLQMITDVKANQQNRWDIAFTDQEINSYFQEDFVNSGEADSLRKLGASDPRVAIDKDRIRIAFRVGSGFW